MAVPAMQALDIFDSGFSDRINSVISKKIRVPPSIWLGGVFVKFGMRHISAKSMSLLNYQFFIRIVP